MLNEAHRSKYAQRVSFEEEFGSSIDPNMYEDMNTLEWEFTGTIDFQLTTPSTQHLSKGQAPKLRDSSPSPDELDDGLIQEYLSELDEMAQWKARESAMVVPPGLIGIDTGDPDDVERAFFASTFPPSANFVCAQ
jgi:hypothetical protein